MLKWLRSIFARARIKLHAAHVRPQVPDAYSTDLQLAGAKYLRWLVDSAEVQGPELVVRGWCLSFTDDPFDIRFLLKGKPFASMEWPLPSEDLAGFYGYIPGATQARFVCRQPIMDQGDIYPEGYARLSAVNRFGEHPRSYRTCWYAPAS